MGQATFLAAWLLSPGALLFGADLTVQISAVFPSPDGTAITSAAINNNGDLAVTTFGAGSERGYGSSYYRFSGGNFTHFVYPGSLGGHANAINDSGQIVGEYYATLTQHYAYIRNPNGNFADLGPAAGANGINNNGAVVGDSYLRDATGNVTPIAFPGASSTSVEGVNDSGQVVGEYCCVSGSVVPFIRSPSGSFTDFPTPQLLGSRFLGIDNSGQILGFSQSTGNFLRDAAGAISRITFFPDRMQVLSVNSKNQVVGVLAANSLGYRERVFIGTLVPASTLVVTSTSPLPPGAVGEFYQLPLYASGGSQPYNWIPIAGTIPNGLSIGNGRDPNGYSIGGLIGVPTTPGTSSFTLRVTDGTSGSTTQTFTVTIAGPLAIASTSTLPPGTQGVPYSQSLAATGGVPPYTWNLAAGSMLPPGLTMSNAGAITGTPTTLGTSSFTVNMYDAGFKTLSQSFTLTIGTGLTIVTGSPLPSGVVGAFYSQTVLAAGGLLPYTWSLASGALPPGLTLSPAGAIGGTPTAQGTFNFTVRVADSSSASATRAFSVTMNASGSLSIDTVSLPAGTVGIAYSQTLAASGGVAPFRAWTIAAGSLPPGITLSTLSGGQTGLLSGVPTTPGGFSFIVQVTDSANTVASKAFSVTINVAAISIGPSGIQNAASYFAGAIAPGEIVFISGSGLGPSTLATLELDGRGYVATSLAGTQVTFDGTPAPLIYVLDGQVSAVVPYGVSGRSSTQVRVSYQGQTSAAVSVPVAAVAPGIFTSDSSGSGQASIRNEDFSVNSPDNPAAAGSVVAVYATGEGQTNPGGVDGKPGGSPAPVPNQQVTARVGGVAAQVTYAGGVTGLVAGVLQVNVQIPAGVTGPAVPLVLNIGGVNTQDGVTLAVK